MAVRSNFVPPVPQAPTGRKLSQQVIKDMRGLNTTDPFGILEDYASPYLRNARMYLSSTERQVAISTRTGARLYTVPVGEDVDDSETDTDSSPSEVLVTNTLLKAAQKVTLTGDVSTKVEVRAKLVSGNSPLVVRIYSDDSGEPGILLATSTIPNSDVDDTFDYASCRFVEAPDADGTYYIVFSTEQGTEYAISTTENSTDGLTSSDGGNSWTAQSYSLNYRMHTADGGEVKGAFRYYPSNVQNKTFFAHGTDIYSVDNGDGSTTSVADTLSANATRYRFAQFNDAVYVVNGFDDLKKSTGGAFADVAGLSTTPFLIESHKNRLFIIDSSNRNRLEFSELADGDTWESASFIYVPAPQSSDPITAIKSFQDTLVIFTKNNKFVLYGSDFGDFQVRQTLGQQGAVSQEAVVADENYVYFVAQDGHMYRWDGTRDEQLSRAIESSFGDVAEIDNSGLVYTEDRILWTFQRSGGVEYNRNFVFETRYNEWFYDKDRYFRDGFTLHQEDDQLVLLSDRAGVLYYGAQTYSDLGKPIEFEYRTNYFDFGAQDNLKQVRRLYLHFRKVNWPGDVTLGTDVDFEDSPSEEHLSLQTSANFFGEGKFFGEEGFVFDTGDQYLRHRIAVPGQATHYQVRVSKTGAETPVYFMSHSEHYRLRRPARG